MQRIENRAEWRRKPVWLTPYLRDPQPEGERDSIAATYTRLGVIILLLNPALSSNEIALVFLLLGYFFAFS